MRKHYLSAAATIGFVVVVFCGVRGALEIACKSDRIQHDRRKNRQIYLTRRGGKHEDCVDLGWKTAEKDFPGSQEEG